MVTSEEWTRSSWFKDANGKQAASIVMIEFFWRNFLYVLKLIGPLVKVLKMVNAEKGRQ